MIGLLDCNNFFVSCERLFRPDLVHMPVLVLSSNDGCVVARSQEVKDLGISMGIPFFEIQSICKKEGITVFSSNFTLYRDISRRVMQALKAEYAVYEVYSIDEAFFEVSDQITTQELLEIRNRIIQKTGIPVSIGVATTKTRAKIANRIAKKDHGVCIMDDVLWAQIIPDMSCSSVWGIGRQTTSTLSKAHVHTVADFLALDPAYVKQSFGIVGERLRLELLGEPVYRLLEGHAHEQQSYTSTRSFGKSTHDKSTLLSALSYHIAQVALKLRKDGMVTREVHIIMHGSRFGDFSHRESSFTLPLSLPTNNSLVLTKAVSQLLDMHFDPEIPYKKAGVLVSGIQPETMSTGDLFSSVIPSKEENLLDHVCDDLGKKFGTGVIRIGTSLYTRLWKEKSTYGSPSYTTQWADICRVKAI